MRLAPVLGVTLLFACSGATPSSGAGGTTSGAGTTSSSATTTSVSTTGTGGAGNTGVTTGAGGAGGAGATSVTTGAGGAGGQMVCADPSAGIGWAGDWGTILSHGCIFAPGLGDPFVFDLSDAGHDCQQITADVWVPGITDVDGDPASIRAEAITTMGSGAVPPELTPAKLQFVGRVGNNYRYVWIPYLGSGVVAAGSYVFSFRFSSGAANDGCWYGIALGDGPSGGAARTAIVQP